MDSHQEQAKQLERELRAAHTRAHKERTWSEDWDAYTAPELSAPGVHPSVQLVRYVYSYAGATCVAAFVHQTLGWYEGSKARSYGRQTYEARAWIRYDAFSGGGSSPPRAALARRLERLHWLADLEPPHWEQVRTKEECVRAIECFRKLRGSHTMDSGATFNASDWGTLCAWPPCASCAAAFKACFSS